MKHKSLALFLALALCLGLSAPALAAEASPVQYTASAGGQTVTFAAYHVADRVYLRLRDVAQLTDAFNVQWDGHTIAITTGTSYTSPNGTEINPPFAGAQSYVQSPKSITVNNVSVDLNGILLTDSAGRGYTYYQPQDLERVLGITLKPTTPETNSTWAAAYIEKVKALAQEDPSLRYALIYMNEDDIPEMVADKSGYYLSLFTYINGQVQTVMDGAYGSMGNGSYEYVPYANVVYNTSSFSPGDQYEEIYRKIGQDGQLERYYDQSLSVWFFEDKNHNSCPDEGEALNAPSYHYGEQMITEAAYRAYKIPGEYQPIQGTMTQREALDTLAAYQSK